MQNRLDSFVRSGVLRSLALVCVVIAVYGNTLTLPFVYDDGVNILENTRLHSFDPLWGPLTSEPGRGVSGRPLAALSFALNYALSGTETWSYHLVNMLIHAAVAVVLCNLILLLLTERRTDGGFADRIGNAAPWLAFWTALIWCAHPLTTQAVTYISQRLESQAALFFLLCIYGALKGAAARRPNAWYLLSVGAYLLGAGTKESVAIAPFLIFFYDYSIRGKRPAAAFAQAKPLYAGLAAAMLLHGLLIVYGGQLETGVKITLIPWHRYVFTQGEVLLHYFRLAFWPAPLVLDYGWPPASLRAGLGPFLLVSALVVATFFGVCRRKAWSFPLLWIFLTLAPTCLAPMVDPAVEYRMYVPLMGVVFLVVLGCHRLLRILGRHAAGRTVRSLAGALGVVAVCALGLASAQRNTEYRDELQLWQDTIDKRPYNMRAYINYGVTLQNRKQYGEAIDYYLRVIEMEPRSCKARIYIGVCLIKQGNPQDALPFLQQAQNCPNPEKRARAYELTANAYRELNNPVAAVNAMREAVRLEPESGRLAYLLGGLYHDAGDDTQAVRQFCRAGELSSSWDQVASELQKFPQEFRTQCATGGVAP